MLKLAHRTYFTTPFMALFVATHSWATDYGTYDSRALAMGGTAVAIGDTSQAAYYNPALLGLHTGDEDETQDGRVYLPSFVGEASNTVRTAVKAVNDELDTKLRDAVNGYNTQKSTEAAVSAAKASQDLRKALNGIANKELNGDGFVGLTVSEPGDHEGGAFYMGARLIGAGTSKVTKTDLDLLDEYIAALDQLAKGAAPATVAAQHPKLIDADGNLVDPTSSLTSSADAGALIIGEWGLALAKEVSLWGQSVSFGVTPKMMRVNAYRRSADFRDPSTNSTEETINQLSDTKNTHNTFNIDVGVAAIIAEHYRVSFAIKDVVAKDFTTRQEADPITGLTPPDLVVKLHPRSRMGLGYINEAFTIGLDYDLQKSTPLANEQATQNLSLGAEYRVMDNLALRVGYKNDRTGAHSNSLSGGIGYRWKRIVADIAYAHSSDTKGGGLQLGWTF